MLEDLRQSGATASELAALLQVHRNREDLITELIHAAGHSDAEVGATWMIRHALSEGKRATEEEQERIVDLCADVGDWISKLHILQSMQFISINKRMADKLVRELPALSRHDKKFVRAWAANAWHLLGLAQPSLNEMAETWIGFASADNAASVQARVRAIRKQRSRVLANR